MLDVVSFMQTSAVDNCYKFKLVVMHIELPIARLLWPCQKELFKLRDAQYRDGIDSLSGTGKIS